MHARLDVVFKAVPRADDVQIRFIESESVAFAALVNHFVHARNNFSLADGSALVRALIEIGVEIPTDAENSDGRLTDVHDQPAAFRHALARSYEYLLRSGWHIPPIAAILW